MNDLILYVSVSLFFALTLYVLRYLEIGQALNIAILAFTATVLIWTTVDAKRNALEAQQADLRPVILRDGVISSWSDFKNLVKSQAVHVTFFVANNVATNVSGYVVADGKKYPFSFAVSKPGEKPGSFIFQPSRESLVTWTLPDKPIMGTTFEDRFSSSTETEGFYVFYSDIGGNKYKTFENDRLQTISEKVSK